MGRMGAVIREVNALFRVGSYAGMTDGQLLELFATRQGEAAELAFSVLVERHGAAVLRVCRTILRNPEDAQDAFQATFLVLVKKSRSVRNRDSVGPWLQGVALRVASCARASETRRRAHEQFKAGTIAEATMHGDPDAFERNAILHQEIGRLPERYRTAILTCHLEGRSCEEAARRLNWPVGTVKSRLARGRVLLRDRLTRRGLAPVAALVGTGVADVGRATGSVLVPPSLANATTRAAVSLAAGGMKSLTQIVSVSVLTITESTMRGMLLLKLKTAVAVVAATGAIGVSGLTASGVVGEIVGLYAAPEAIHRFLGNLGMMPGDRVNEATPRPEVGQNAAQAPSSVFTAQPAYIVEPPDLLIVEASEALPGKPITGERLVRPDGTISLDYYGPVYVAGLTLGEIKEKIILHLQAHLSDEALGLIVTDPETGQTRRVTPRESSSLYVDVAAYNSKPYYVMGEVASPGRFPITGKDSILDAINYAGGITIPIERAVVRLIRPSNSAGDVMQAHTVDYAGILEGDNSTNFQIRHDDRIFVTAARPIPADGEATESAAEDHKVSRPAPALGADLDRRLGAVEESRDGRPKAIEQALAPGGTIVGDEPPLPQGDMDESAAEMPLQPIPDLPPAPVTTPVTPYSILAFHADWSVPSRQFQPTLARLVQAGYPIRTIDFHTEPGLARRFEVEEIPSLVVIDANGQVVERILGVQREEDLRRRLAEFVAGPAPPRPKATASEVGIMPESTDIDRRLGALEESLNRRLGAIENALLARGGTIPAPREPVPQGLAALSPLRVEMLRASSPIALGRPVYYDILVRNTGTRPVRGARVRVELRGGLRHESGARVLELKLSEAVLPNGGEELLPGMAINLPTLQVMVAEAGRQECSATVSAPGLGPSNTVASSVEVGQPDDPTGTPELDPRHWTPVDTSPSADFGP